MKGTITFFYEELFWQWLYQFSMQMKLMMKINLKIVCCISLFICEVKKVAAGFTAVIFIYIFIVLH